MDANYATKCSTNYRRHQATRKTRKGGRAVSERPRLYHFEVAQAMPSAWRAYRNRPSVYAVLSAIACAHMDGRTGETSIGAQTLATELGLSLRSVRAALAQLVKDGWLVRVKRGGGRVDGTNGCTTVYRILIPQQCNIDCTVSPSQQCNPDCTVSDAQQCSTATCNSAMEGSQQCNPDCTQSDISDKNIRLSPAAPDATALFASGDGSTKQGKKYKPNVTHEKQPAEFRQLTDYWLSQWQATHGMKAPDLNGRGGKILAGLWTATGKSLLDAQATIRAYLSDDGKFYEGHPLNKLECDLHKFILRARNGVTNGKRFDSGTITERLVANAEVV